MENTQNTEVGNTQGQKDAVNGVTTTPTKEEKTFTQTDINEIVAGRLKKEREKYADYDNLKTSVGELQEYKTKYTELEKSSKVNEDALKEVFEGFTSELDDEKKALIPEQLNLVDKIKYINKNRKTFSIRPVIQTPPPEDKSKGEAGLYGGKYKDIQEWASKDPQGYLTWRKGQK